MRVFIGSNPLLNISAETVRLRVYSSERGGNRYLL